MNEESNVFRDGCGSADVISKLLLHLRFRQRVLGASASASASHPMASRPTRLPRARDLPSPDSVHWASCLLPGPNTVVRSARERRVISYGAIGVLTRRRGTSGEQAPRIFPQRCAAVPAQFAFAVGGGREAKYRRLLQKMVLPDRIELFWSNASPLKDHGFFEPLISAVYQREDHL